MALEIFLPKAIRAVGIGSLVLQAKEFGDEIIDLDVLESAHLERLVNKWILDVWALALTT
jgi:hypothetical protein